MVQSEIANFTRPEYRAPEQLDLQSGYEINEKVDSWCLGIVLYQMMFFKMPFTSKERDKQRKGKVSFPRTNRYNRNLRKLLKRLLEPNPKERPSVKQVFRFIENIQAQST